jgi:hypothetical protein
LHFFAPAVDQLPERIIFTEECPVMQTGPSPRPSCWHQLVRELLPFLVLFTASFKATYDEWKTRDLTRTDEVAYVSFALLAADPWGWVSLEAGPLYVLWYQLLTALPIRVSYLPYVSHTLLLATLAGLFYALARRLGAGRWMGVAVTALLFFNTRIAMIEPFPVHLVTVWFALGVLVGTYRRSLLGAAGPLGFSILAACYTRPEFGTLLPAFLSVYLTAGFCAWWRRAACRWEFLPWAIPLVVAAAVCGYWFGIPLPDGPRGWIAFGQHYARNVEEAGTRGFVGWAGNWEMLTREDFGEAKTVGHALRVHPEAIAWHIGRNLTHLPTAITDLCIAAPKLAATPRIIIVPFVFAGLGLGVVGLIRRIRGGGLHGPEGQPLRAVLLALTSVAFVSGAAVVVIYPRDHYLLLPLFFLLVLAVSGLPAPRWPAHWVGNPTRAKRFAAAVATTVLIVGVTPTARYQWTFLRPLMTNASHAYPTADLSWGETMELLHSLPRQQNLVVMDYGNCGPVRTGWMAWPTVSVSHASKTERFWAFAAKHHLDVIVLDPRLLKDERFASDPEFLALWNETDTGPYVMLTSGGSRIAVRRDLAR